MRKCYDIKWSRIEEIKKNKKYNVFVEGASVKDIKQGNIGDCYLLSALGALCNIPGYIEKLFYLEKEQNHMYGVYFFI